MNVSGVMDMMEARGKNVLKRAMTMCKAQGRSEVLPAPTLSLAYPDHALRQHQDTLTEKIVYTKDTREGLLHQMEKQEVDLVCMGSRGLGGVGKALLGSTSAYLLQHAPAKCSILVLKDTPAAS
jgi:hypothetical protein